MALRLHLQAFLELRAKLEGEKQYISEQIEQRIQRLKRKTENKDADPAHLSDVQFMQLAAKQESSMAMQLDKMLVRPGILPSLDVATRAHGQLSSELLTHAQTHANALLRVAQISSANQELLAEGAR